MKKIYFLFVIALIGTLFVMNSCELITNQNNQIEVPAIVSQVLSYDGQNLVSEGTADFADNGSYQELKKNLTNNKVISGFVLKTIEDNAPATGTLARVSTLADGIWTAFILDPSNIWVVNSRDPSIRHSSDGGKTFIIQSNPTSNQIFGFTFTNAFNGWAVGANGTVLHTTNGGATWTQQNSGIGDLILWAIQFLDNNNGWAVGTNGIIVHTSDGGANWTTQNGSAQSTSDGLNDVHFIDQKNGWAVGENGTILHTTDGGNNWINQSSGTSNTLAKIKFTDSKNGWIVGNNGTILQSTDSGNNWISKNPIDAISLSDIQFLDANNGWILGLNYLWSTIDGGNTWSKIPIPRSNYFSFPILKFFDQNSGLFVTESSVISYSRTPKFNFQFTIKDANNPSNVLLTRNMENISITDWYAHPYTIVLTRAERDIVSNYFKNTSKFIYDISLVDDKITPFSFKLNMQTYLVSGMKLSTN